MNTNTYKYYLTFKLKKQISEDNSEYSILETFKKEGKNKEYKYINIDDLSGLTLNEIYELFETNQIVLIGCLELNDYNTKTTNLKVIRKINFTIPLLKETIPEKLLEEEITQSLGKKVRAEKILEELDYEILPKNKEKTYESYFKKYL